MSTGPMMSIGGIASGLPPDLVDQIMEAERQPLNRLVARQEGLAQDREAWTAVTQKLSGVRSAVDEVRRGNSFADLFTAETTGDAADVAVTGRPPQGSASFEVTQLAQAQRSFSDHAFDGLDAALGDLTLAIDGTDVTADLDAEATLADLVDAVNAADLGVTASTVQVEPGSYSLVLAGTETGAEQAFTVDAGGGWGFQTARAAQDAELDVEGLAVSRPSNTIDDLFEGLTLELQETGPATVSADRDVDAAVEQVTGLVERVNEAIGTLSELTAYDPETDEAGPLQGDRTARSIMDDLRGALTGLANPGGEEGFRR
ncbi:MAG: flagellar filament capping protein FliD, partial [Egibacteraceae bacterium]